MILNNCFAFWIAAQSYTRPLFNYLNVYIYTHTHSYYIGFAVWILVLSTANKSIWTSLISHEKFFQHSKQKKKTKRNEKNWILCLLLHGIHRKICSSLKLRFIASHQFLFFHYFTCTYFALQKFLKNYCDEFRVLKIPQRSS